MELGDGDVLNIYDGANISAPLLASITNQNFMLSTMNTFMSSFSNSSKKLTLQFITDGNSQAAGFKIFVRCNTSNYNCKRVVIVLDEENSSRIPVPDPEHPDGFNYVKLCPGEENTTMAVKLIFPDSNAGGYTQTLQGSFFTWRINETSQSGTGLNSITSTFQENRAYTVRVDAEDNMGCTAWNPLIFRVMMSSNPIDTTFHPEMPLLCAGEGHSIELQWNDPQIISVTPSHGDTIISSAEVTGTVFLPDGPNCPGQGAYYESVITFSGFSENAKITSPDDLSYVKINMEHSYIGDIWIQIFCPNGTVADIVPDPGNNAANFPSNYGSGYTQSVYLGVPVDDNGCSGPPGTGWDYIWSSKGNGDYVYADGSPNPGDRVGTRVVSTVNHESNKVKKSNEYMMTQIYAPYTSFWAFATANCPLNGDWKIRITDKFAADNGYIFGWSLKLDERMAPQSWGYLCQVTHSYLSNNEMDTFYDGRIVAGYDTVSGIRTENYLMHVVDNFGCTYTHNFSIQVQTNLGYDTVLVFQGDPIDVIRFGRHFTSEGTHQSIDQNVCENGCDSVLYLTVIAVPKADPRYDTVEICEDKFPFTYEGLIINIPGNYQVTKHNHTIQQHGYTLTGDSVIFVNVKVKAPVVRILQGQDYCEEFVTTLTAVSESNVTHYLWNTGVAIDMIEVQEAGKYEVTITDDEGCLAWNEIVIPPCLPYMILPNSITPSDKNGLNDWLFLPQSNLLKSIDLRIYDRYGNLIYHTTDRYFRWDGRNARGEIFYNVSYNYILFVTDFENRTKRYTGTIMVL
jgi:subtilisin-like proprotein convertase family protein